MDERDSIVRGDLLIEGDRIASIGSNGQTGDTVIDASVALLFLVSFKLTFIFARRCFVDQPMTLP